MAEATRKKPAEVLVIGSGASGAIASLVLGQAGLQVVCLEQGGWTLPDDHPHMSQDWEWQRQKRWHPNNNIRRGRDDFPVESTSSNILMWNAVGGSTNVYTALWPRYRPSDFRKGVEHGLAPDWPISYEDLAPYYDRVDRLVGASGLAGNPAMPPHQDYPTPPLPLRPVGRKLAQAFDRLGWHWWPIPAGVISEDYDGRPACNGCSACAAGCARGSMSKFSLSVWPKALAAGVELRPFARVERLEHGADGRLSGAVYIDRRTGIRHFQAAEVVIVACNGVGTPRLLLMSGDLANGSDQVGRNLMHHTLVAAEMWVEEPLHSHMGFIGALIGMEFAETDVKRGFVNGFNFNCATAGHAGGQSIGFVTPASAPWGKGHHEWFRRHFSHGCAVFAIGDDLPQASNRVTLSDTEKDADGLPAPKISVCSARERPAHDALRAAAARGHRAGCRCLRLSAARLHVEGRRVPDPGLAPARHLPDGRGSRDLGDQPLAPGLGRAQSVHRRWQRAHHRRRGQPDQHDLRAGAARGRAPARQLRRPSPRHQVGRGLTKTT